MSRKGKIEPENKIKIVCECLDGRISLSQAAKTIGVHCETIREWIQRYQIEGSLGLSNILYYFVVYIVKRYAVMYISGCYFCFQYKAVLVAGGMRFISKLLFMLSLYE